MSPPSPLPDTNTVPSDSAASTRDSASVLAELAGQAILLLQKADPHTVVTGLLKEKSYLHTQNGQLWRLVDKQRAALLSLQRDYQKVLNDRDRFQDRLRALKQDSGRPFNQSPVSTESSSTQQGLDTNVEGKQMPSPQFSSRSENSQRTPRTSQPSSPLDVLQASLEAEIAKSHRDTNITKTVTPPSLLVESSAERTEPRPPKRVPTPLDLSANKSRTSEPLSRSSFLLPGTGPENRNGRISPAREPPPSAPPFQTITPKVSPTFKRRATPLFSPGLPASPRPYTASLQISPPMMAKTDTFDTLEPRVQRGSPSTIRTSKPPTPIETMDELTDSSSSPHTPNILSRKEVYVETITKSPVASRRVRIPSHRSSASITHTSTSSIMSVNEPIAATSPIVGQVLRALSAETNQPNGGNLVPPQESLERRKSRSFDDLHSLSDTFNEIKASTNNMTHSRNASVAGIGLDDAINEIQRANEQPPTPETKEIRGDATVEPTRRAPSSPSTSQKSPTTLQPAFTARTRSPSSASRLVSLAINPKDVFSVALSVLSVRSGQVSIPSGPVEETLFTIRCQMKNPVDKSDSEIMRVEKSISSLRELGEKLSGISGMAPFLNSFFDDFPVEKSAQRKAIDYFFGVLLGSQLDDGSLHTVAEFLSTDIVKKHDSTVLDKRRSVSPSTKTNSPTHTAGLSGVAKDTEPPKKEGYLTKRGKNFGGWQPRYFILDGPQLKYFDAPNGVHLGSIKLPQAQIGRQTAKSREESDDSDDEQMKFAFLILEPKRNDASKTVRHVLCSQSDEDRDEWINALLYYVALDLEPVTVTHSSEKISRGKRLQRRQSDASAITALASQSNAPENAHVELETIGVRYDQTAAGKRPTTSANEASRPTTSAFETHRQTTWPQVQDDGSRGIDRRMARSPDPRNDVRQAAPVIPLRSPYRAPISAPMNGGPITDDSAWSSAQREEERRREEKRAKKRSVWSFLSKDYRGRATPEHIQPTAPPPPALLQHGLFGIPLRDAVDITREMGMGINVPSVIYRCVEYLEHMDAAKEEGIYRLSGSNSAIRMLKDKFNTEGDVDLVNSRDYYDIHAVAGLLKLYLRELPITVLTRERHVEFLHIVDIEDKNARVRRLSELIHGLPKVNYELLRIMSKHLKRIVRRAQENKMTIRNVGIVFSPTLNIPAPVLSLFITEYEVVFDEPDDTPVNETPATVTAPPEAQSYNASNYIHEPTPISHTNHHLNVHHDSSHRRYHSAEPPHRGAPPASFPKLNQGYQESSHRPQAYHQQSYPQQTYQQSFQQQSYRPNVNTSQSSNGQGRWDSSREESSDLFG